MMVFSSSSTISPGMGTEVRVSSKSRALLSPRTGRTSESGRGLDGGVGLDFEGLVVGDALGGGAGGCDACLSLGEEVREGPPFVASPSTNPAVLRGAKGGVVLGGGGVADLGDGFLCAGETPLGFAVEGRAGLPPGTSGLPGAGSGLLTEGDGFALFIAGLPPDGSAGLAPPTHEGLAPPGGGAGLLPVPIFGMSGCLGPPSERSEVEVAFRTCPEGTGLRGAASFLPMWWAEGVRALRAWEMTSC